MMKVDLSWFDESNNEYDNDVMESDYDNDESNE